MFLRRISRLQAQHVERAVKLGDMATAHEKPKRRSEREAQEIGFARSRRLRCASERAALELDYSIAVRLKELKRFALYESTDAHDELFIKGWIENPLALQGSLGTSATRRWMGGWVVVVDGLPGPWAQDRFRARLAPLPRGGGWVRGGG